MSEENEIIEDITIREAIDSIYDMLAELPKENGFKNTKFFVDDGYSGVSFTRPAFMELMELAEAGQIETIIVKDHSRLGRNRLVVGQLLEEDFVRLGVRYIAIMDNIDTKDGLSDFLPVQDWFNEMHAKNTSKKVSAVFQNKGMSGKLTDERFDTMSANYEAEQKSLKEAVAMLRNEIEAQDDKTANVLAFVEKVKRYTEIKELTPAIVNEFIDYIMVSKKQVIDGKTVYPIDIYYNGVGIITAPSAEEYEEMFQERLKQKRAKEPKTA